MEKTLSLPPLAQAFMDEVAKQHHPQARVVDKSSSWLMKAIDLVVGRFNHEFMDSYITTIGSTIYVPSHFLTQNSDVQIVEILAHETQHIIDYAASPVLFTLGYLFPQVLALLSIFAVFAVLNPWMLLCLLFLVFLAPCPSYGRYKAELNGYRTSILLARNRPTTDNYRTVTFGFTDDEMVQLRTWISKQMTTANYYFAWPFPSWIERDLKDEGFMMEPRYQEIIKFLQRHNRLPS
jgi:hypothetical protein